MKRKVNKVGPSTLTVSLPSSWVKKYAIKQGDEIELEEKGPSIEIWSQKGVSLGQFRFKIQKGTHSYIKSIITNSYKKGYDKIVLEFDEEEVLWEIQKIVDSLMGIEIISRNKHYCEIINISKELEEEFDSIFKNSFILLMENMNQIIEDLKKSKFDNVELVTNKSLIITKYTDFCKRILNKHRRNDNNVIFQYLIVWSMEKTSNEYKYLYKYCSDYKIKNPSKGLLKYFEDTNNLVLLYYQAYYEKNLNKIKELSKIKDRMLYEQFYPNLKKIPIEEFGVIHHLSFIVRRVWDMSGALHGLTF